MILDIPVGKIILTPREIVIKVTSGNAITLQAYSEAIELYRDSCVIVANAGELKWTFRLDSSDQIDLIANELGIDIH